MPVKAAVLMSTYNGETYLREQLDSILHQRDVEISVFVRDDGSSDGTQRILKEYAGDHRIEKWEAGSNLGVGLSFMRLLYSLPDCFDYYAFSDQDDIWEPNKLSEAIRVLTAKQKGLYASNQMCVDENGAVMGLRYAAKPDYSRYGTLQQNSLSGCTMVMTRTFFQMLTDPSRRPDEKLFSSRIHDVWIAMTGIVTHQIVYDARSFIRYRQHARNEVGAKRITTADRLKKAARKLRAPEKTHGRSTLAKAVCGCYGDYVGGDALLHAAAEPTKLRNKAILIRNRSVFHADNELLFVLYVLFNLF